MIVFVSSINIKKIKINNLEQIHHQNSLFLIANAKTNENAPIYSLEILNDSYLKTNAPPFLIKNQTLASLNFANNDSDNKKEIIKYTVQQGDTLEKIALQYKISTETIIWANNLSFKNAKLKEGQELIILPVSGVLHMVQFGETLNQISLLYKVSRDEIIKINNIKDENQILAGDFLIIPAGKPLSKPSQNFIPIGDTYFIFPVPKPFRITQGLHWYNAVDFSTGNCGDPVFAVAGGIVQKTGYDDICGNFVRILHPNGVITFYGHLSTILVQPGQEVHQGTCVGYIGFSGKTIPQGPAGCHLHFDVRFGVNPFTKYPVGTEIK
ncbi:MAG: LysM peptidoglycan-binding domain-containing protein [Minisyncoccia bacterium]